MTGTILGRLAGRLLLTLAMLGLLVAPGMAKAAPHSTRHAEVATLGGGCFWCMEAVFDELKGVQRVVSGFSGGHVPHPTYEQVCTGETGHAEVVEVTFDPSVLSYSDLLRVYFTVHDPTTLNRQGADEGPQYRSVIFAHSIEQAKSARAVIQEVSAAKVYDAPIVTEIAPFTAFYPAEGYHQGYFAAHPDQPYCALVIAPKVEKFRRHFLERLKRP